MLNKIIKNVLEFDRHIYDLKDISPIYPEIHLDIGYSSVSYTTMVEFIYNEVRYKRHHVEIAHKAPFYSEEQWDGVKNKTIERLNAAAKECIEKAIPCKYDDIISII